jgi:hypothetical protein
MHYIYETRTDYPEYNQLKNEAGGIIPIDTDNRDYAQYLIDVAEDPSCRTTVDMTPVPTVDELRIAAYGSIGDQLDEIYHDVDAWRVRIKAVKDNNPKG